MDKMLRTEIVAEVRRATMEMAEAYEERWVTGQELCRSVAMITPQWLKVYGRLLPRECVRVMDADGVEHRTRWAYPVKKILRMVNAGELRRLVMSAQ